jgi:hypothetical protein
MQYFRQKNFQKTYLGQDPDPDPELAEKLFRSGSGSRSGRFQKSYPDPVKNRPDPQHRLKKYLL